MLLPVPLLVGCWGFVGVRNTEHLLRARSFICFVSFKLHPTGNVLLSHIVGKETKLLGG